MKQQREPVVPFPSLNMIIEGSILLTTCRLLRISLRFILDYLSLGSHKKPQLVVVGQSRMEKGLRRRNLCLSLPKVSDVGSRALSILRLLTLESGAYRQLTCETSFNILSSKKERFISRPRVSSKECAYYLIDGILPG